MKIGMTIYTNNSEVVWNALRFANFALAAGDNVKLFLIGSGVEIDTATTEKFNVAEQINTFLDTGGKIWACGTCLQIHGVKPGFAFTTATLKDLYEIVKESDKVITF